MQEAGTVLFLARSGRLILRASSTMRDGTPLVDVEGRRTGRVMETIGPVRSPYLSVQPTTDRIERLIGSKLFVSEAPFEMERERRRSFTARPRFDGKGKERRKSFGSSRVNHEIHNSARSRDRR